MQTVFLATAATGGGYLLLSHRRVDLFTLAFVSSCVYFLPGFFGCVPQGVSRTATMPLEDETFLVMAVVLGAIAAGAWMFDPHGPVAPCRARTSRDRLAAPLALLLALGGVVMAVRTGGDALFSADKEEVLAAVTRWFYLYAVSASLAAVLAFLHRQWLVMGAALGLLLFSVYLGFRADLAMVVIGVFLLHFHAQGPQRLVRRNQLALLLAAASAMFFFSYKFVYRLVKLGEYQLAVERALDPQFHLAAVTDSEPFATQLVLNEVVRTRFTTDLQYIFDGVASQCLFFSEQFGMPAVGFNELFQPVLFPEVSWGMAGNIWAQMLAAGGWPLLLAFLVLFVLTLRVGSRWLETPRLNVRAAIALATSYWAFYIHRNDVGYQVMLEKRVVVIWLAVVVVCEAIHRLGAPSRAPSLPRRHAAGPLLRPRHITS